MPTPSWKSERVEVPPRRNVSHFSRSLDRDRHGHTEAPCNCNDKRQTNGTRPCVCAELDMEGREEERTIQEVSGNYPPEKRENTHPHTPKPPEWDDGKIFSDRNSITVFLLSSCEEDSGYPTNNSHNAVEGISEPLDGRHTCTRTHTHSCETRARYCNKV